ncbi:glycine oxidase ThiO [Ectothiorhodospiraceae bacterium 2226]|nr:glycine oxidase ThiO [Ectothiorhodospiraceae bacterium 2226]
MRARGAASPRRTSGRIRPTNGRQGVRVGKSDVIVVGGGLIGLLTARELALGGVEVRVVERGQTGRESSWAGGGILSPLYPWRYPEAVTALAAWSQRHYPELCRALADETPTDPEWTQSGLLVLDAADEADAAAAWAARHGVAIERLAGEAVQAVEPALGTGARGVALWFPELAQVRNPRLVRAARQSLDARGMAVLEHTPVEGFVVADGRVTGVRTAQGVLAAERVVVAGGAWTAELLRATGYAPAVEPVKGQMILLKGPPGLVQRVVLSRDRYVIPRRDGHVLVGSTLESAGFDVQPSAEVAAELRREAARIVPALGELPLVHHWAGLRPGSPDGTPYIGEHPGVRGLYINAGHFRNGVVMGYASARLLSDLMLARPPVVDPQPYRPRAPG